LGPRIEDEPRFSSKADSASHPRRQEKRHVHIAEIDKV
jgi:hypothetical protein